MKLHSCLRCGVSFKQKSHVRKHYKKKRLCRPIISDMSIDECLSRLNEKFRFECKHCGKDFMYNSYLNKHVILCQEKRIKQLQDENKELKNSSVTNITNVDNSINIDASQKIYINNFRETDIESIRDDIDSLKIENKRNIDVIATLLNIIHFNEKYPENHNLYVENASSKRVMKLENGRFNEDGRGNKAIEKILKDDIDNYVENHLNDTPFYSIYENLMIDYNNLDADDRDNRREKNDRRSEILDTLRNVLYNGREIVKDTARSNGIKIK